MEEELDFAGHPVLGSAAVLHKKYGIVEVENWIFRMRKNDVRVKTKKRGGAYFATMYQPQADFGASAIPQLAAQELISAPNLKVDDLYPSLPLEMVSTGLPYVVVPLQANIDKAAIVVDNLEELLLRHGASSYTCMMWRPRKVEPGTTKVGLKT
jgi:trans-2,3-dihydro-3-hydroxyanthranilate isomerase